MKKLSLFLACVMMLSLVGCRSVKKNRFVPTDDTKSEEYNVAMNAFDQFLEGKLHAMSMDEVPFFVGDMTTASGDAGIGTFAVMDLSKDGIPELLTIGSTFTVFSYTNKQVMEWYDSEGKSVHVLSEPALVETVEDGGRITYHAISFAKDGTVTTVEFADNTAVDGTYIAEGETVDKETWDRYYGRYCDEINKEPLTWTAYTTEK